MSPSRRALLFALTFALAGAILAPGVAAEDAHHGHGRHRPPHPECVATPSYASTAPLFGLSGLYELPSSTPTALAVYAHGYGNSSVSWIGHLMEARARGVAAVAMDYTGLGPAPGYRGWPVRAGARDMITAAQYFMKQCPTISRVVMFGVSMGGNSSGLAIAADAKRHGGAPLFDYWIDIEGVASLIEEYELASAAALSGNQTGINAKQDIENECGGPPSSTTASCYQSETVTSRAADIKASGVKAVVLVHAVEDGEVPSNQSRELSTELRGLGITTDVFNVLRKTSNPDDNSSEATLLGDAGQGKNDPFAGHTWEGTSDTAVMGTSLTLLWDLIAGTYRPATQEHMVDPASGIQPPPA